MTDTFRSDETALTPVVGILLLLSLTVLLAATAATFAMGLSEEPHDSPTASFAFEADRQPTGSDTVSIEHQSGETIDADNLYVVVDGATCKAGGDDPDGRYNIDDDFEMGPSEMASGMEIRYGTDIDIDGNPEICPGGDISVDGATFTVVWKAPGTNSVQLQRWAA